jgi:hypothetical protein
MIASIEQQRELHDRVDKDGYPLMNPFVAGITRADNVRIYDPKSIVWPYNGEPRQ